MYLDAFSDNSFETNCWLLGDRRDRRGGGGRPGFSPERVRALLDAEGTRPVAAFATHGHFDHIGSAAAFCGDDLPFYIHEADVAALTDPQGWGPGSRRRRFREGRSDGRRRDVLTFAGFEIQVVHTPGHTPGSVCLSTDAVLLSGDLVFAGAIGRSDFPNSSPADMERSLERFLELPDPTDVLPGHGPEPPSGANADPTPSSEAAEWSSSRREGPTTCCRRLRRDAGAVRGRTPVGAPVRVPVRRDADVRAHGAVRAHLRRDLGRGDEGDVHVRGQGRAVADAAARADGEHRPRLPLERARPANPFKAYHVSSQFRHGRPQAGRLREFRQFGVEIVARRRPGRTSR
jgi:glyoxylase-like metal-dependent hydrolase (beta-lactamase superfamily II)